MPSSPDGGGQPGPGDEVIDFVRGTRLKIAGLTAFKKGAEVLAVGLQHNAHLNGRAGTVAGFDDARKRWVVDLGDGLGKKLFLEANLSPAVVEALLPPPPLAAAPPGPAAGTLAARPAPAAQGAPAAEDSGDEVVELFKGARVRVGGLGAKNGELNGRLGTLLEYHQERQRWIVELEGDLGRKMLRAANLAPAGAASGPGRPAAAPAAALEAQLPPPEGAPGAAPRNLRPGAQVLVGGLAGQGLEHLNGQVGVCEHCEFMTGCWTVFFSSGVKAKLRPEYFTLQPATLRPGAYVRLQGLQKAGHLNGRMGICGRLDPEGLRWEVHLDSGENKSLKEENLAPQDGYKVPREEGPTEQNLAATFEEALQSGEISWLDC